VKKSNLKKSKQMLVGVFVILLFQLVGEAVQQYFQLAVPGPVIGLVLLLALLLVARPSTSAALSSLRANVISTAEGLLAHLSLLFVPIGVGVIMHLQLLETHLFSVVGIVLVGTISTILFTAVLFARLVKRDGNE
jgi:holin-like protein